MTRSRKDRRDLHALDENGMVLCNPRDREAAHRAEMEGIATDDRSAVTCGKCRDLLYRTAGEPRGGGIAMPANFQIVFARLREILKAHAAGLTVGIDTSDHYSLDGIPGPATLKAWRGKLRSPTILAAAVQIRKSYVSFHLMGIYTNPKLLNRCSRQLMQRMQGKSCLNFKEVDEPLFEELERLTAESIAGMREAGFIEE